MISVGEALHHIFDLCAPLGTETVDLRRAHGRVLAKAAAATRAQPPFNGSAMDGYGIAEADAQQGKVLAVVGESAAGHGYDGALTPGQAIRIFTGAPVPPGVERVVIQENVRRTGDQITLSEPISENRNIRPAGGDFSLGDSLAPGRRLSPEDIVLLAAMNVPQVEVTRQPTVALIATGDELVMPGETPSETQIIASNSFGLAAMIEQAGGIARILPIARDEPAALRQVFELASGADMIVTSGGASVGDHDLVGTVAADLGLARAFYKVAMRPGKPLMAGRLGGSVMLGLPGNPVSAMVTGRLFMRPALEVMQGLPAAPAARRKHKLLNDLPENGPREHYMRATLTPEGVRVMDRQDSALTSVLSTANALIVHPPHAPARAAGTTVDVIAL